MNADLKNGNINSGIGLINRHSHPQFNNKISLMIWVEVLKMVTSVVVNFFMNSHTLPRPKNQNSKCSTNKGVEMLRTYMK